MRDRGFLHGNVMGSAYHSATGSRIQRWRAVLDLVIAGAAMAREWFSRRQLLRRGLGLGAALGGVALAGDVTAVAEGWQPRALTVPERGGASALLASASVAGGGADITRPPIIFVHGNSNSSSLWLAQAWRFEAHGWPRDRLVAIDHPYPTARRQGGPTIRSLRQRRAARATGRGARGDPRADRGESGGADR